MDVENTFIKLKRDVAWKSISFGGGCGMNTAQLKPLVVLLIMQRIWIGSS